MGTVYSAPEIIDRVAVGDDLYLITDADGKKRLTPSPTEVTAVGTPINKALLQPLVNAVAGATADIAPYAQHWWRRRAMSGGYVEKGINSGTESDHKTAWHYDSNSSTYKSYVSAKVYVSPDEGESYTRYATLQYSNGTDIDQTTAAISLKNPSTYEVSSSDNVSSSSFYERFRGKYVKGFIWCEDVIFFIPPNMEMRTQPWQLSDSYRTYYGYEFTADSTLQPMRITAVKNTATGAWEIVSSDSESTYPKTGESGGYQWEYKGTPFDSAVKNISEWVTIKITSANYNGSSAYVPIPAPLALVSVTEGIMFWNMTEERRSFWGIIDSINGKAYGLGIPGVTSKTIDIYSGVTDLGKLADTTTVTVVDGGITLTNTSSWHNSNTVSYLPLA